MNKYLSILAVVSTLLISGCIDSSDSESGNEFFGVWKTECQFTLLTTYIFSEESLALKGHEFENDDCTGAEIEDGSVILEFRIAYGDRVTVGSGVEATRIETTKDDDAEYRQLNLLYRDGNTLYFGDDTGTDDTWPTDIDFDAHLTLQ